MLYYIDELKQGDSHEIALEYIFDRYAIKTEINAEMIIGSYDKESEFFLHYTGKNDYCNPELAEMKQLPPLSVCTLLRPSMGTGGDGGCFNGLLSAWPIDEIKSIA